MQTVSRLILTALAGTAWLAACATSPAIPAPAPVSILQAEASAQAGAAGYTITWATDTAGAPVDVYVAGVDYAEAAARTLIASDVTDAALSWTPDASETPHYFVLVPEAGAAVSVGVRVLPLEGGRNFRDLGGYVTEDGRRVKWGRLFRSGVMTGLTAKDYDYLDALGMDVVCDLRTAEERAAEPTRWGAAPVDYLTFPDPEAADASRLAAVFRDPDVTPAKVAAVMTSFYSDIAAQQAPAYRVLFDRLAAGEMPLAFNCSAGKDRTGVAAALILTVLGVPRETVVQDYALSEKVVDYAKAFSVGDGAAGDPDSPYAFLRQLPPELVAPLMRSDPAYIEAALTAMEASHGSVLAWIREELDVTDAEIAAIRENLLE